LSTNDPSDLLFYMCASKNSLLTSLRLKPRTRTLLVALTRSSDALTSASVPLACHIVLPSAYLTYPKYSFGSAGTSSYWSISCSVSSRS
jgi:hypothetical protein